MTVKYLCFVVFCCVSMISCHIEKDKKGNKTKKIIEMDDTRQLRHIVLFKFKVEVSKAKIDEVGEAFAELPKRIKEIKGFEWGLNNSPEHLNKGFTHGFLLTFDSEEGRDIYLPHPDHKAFGEIVDPLLEDVFVLDYWTK